MVYEMLDTEGLYMGASSALNVVAAEELAKKLGPGKSPFLFNPPQSSPVLVFNQPLLYRKHRRHCHL